MHQKKEKDWSKLKQWLDNKEYIHDDKADEGCRENITPQTDSDEIRDTWKTHGWSNYY